LIEDELLGGGRAATAVLLRPVQAGVSGVEKPTLPVRVVLAPLVPRFHRRLRRERRQLPCQPLPQLRPERGVFLGGPQVHTPSLESDGSSETRRRPQARATRP